MNARILILASAALCMLPGCWSRKRHTEIITEETVRGSGPENWGADVLEELNETDPIK